MYKKVLPKPRWFRF